MFIMITRVVGARLFVFLYLLMSCIFFVSEGSTAAQVRILRSHTVFDRGVKCIGYRLNKYYRITWVQEINSRRDGLDIVVFHLHLHLNAGVQTKKKKCATHSSIGKLLYVNYLVQLFSSWTTAIIKGRQLRSLQVLWFSNLQYKISNILWQSNSPGEMSCFWALSKRFSTVI